MGAITGAFISDRYHGGDFVLPPGNTYQYMDTYIVPEGTTILEGTVAPNFGQPGGGYQFYVPDPSVVIKQ